MSRRVLIYRSELLPSSETFIAAQAGSLRRYLPVFAGCRRSEPSLPLPAPVIACAGADWYSRLLYRQIGFAPGFLLRARKQAPALVHAHFALDAAEALPLVRSLRVPLVVTLHGYDVMCADQTHRGSRRGRVYLARRDELWSRAALFVCVSEAIRRSALARGFPERKLVTLPIGIDTALFAPAGELPQAPTVLFIGRLVPKKGCHLLLQAIARVQEVLPNARLVIAGDGPERASLEATAALQTVRTRFLGRQTPEQVRALMRSARCLAVPSITAPDGDAEGLPTVLCEALAFGLPGASTVHSGIPELITHGEHGLLAAEGDVEALAENLLTLCTHDARAEQFRAAGRVHVESCFHLGTQTAQLEQLYDRVVAEHGPVVTRPGPATQPRPSAGWAAEDKTEAAAGAATTQGSMGCPKSEEKSEESSKEPLAQAFCAPVAPEALAAGLNGRAPAAIPPAPAQAPRLRHQAAWLLSGNGAAMLFQALYFLLIGRMLGSRQYGALIGAVALVNVLSQFSSLGMEMVLLRTVARDRTAFAPTWARALVLCGAGFLALLLAVTAYGHWCLPPAIRPLLPYLAISDALFGKLTQLSSRALQGAGFASFSAQLLAGTNAVRAGAAGLLFVWTVQTHAAPSVLGWVQLYAVASLLVAAAAVLLVTRLLGPPRWMPIRCAHLSEGLSFSFSNSAISVYNDIDKALLVSHGMLVAAGIYAAAYRVVDVVSTPIFSLFGAASPRLFAQGARDGPRAAMRGAHSLLRWAIPFGCVAAGLLALSAPALPRVFGASFAASVSALRLLCVLPLLRGLHYAWGTAITACANQWWRTAAQAGTAGLNLGLNLWLIPRWGWQGAAVASLLSDGALAALSFAVLRVLVLRERARAPAGLNDLRGSGGRLQCGE